LAEAHREAEAIARFDEARGKEAAAAKAALPRLASALGRAAAGDDAPARRAAAAAVLARLPDGEEPLIKLAADKDRTVRAAALEALGAPGRGPAARDLLIR